MVSYLLRRFVFAVVLVFTVSSGSLLLTRFAPGDYATETLGFGAASERTKELRARYGLDRPVLEQYRGWLAGALRFDFGRSLAYDRPVADLIPSRAANTAVLAVTALLVATAFGLPLGVVTGSRPDGWLAALVRAISVLLLSMPPLLTSLFLVFLAARTGWLPIGGMGTPQQVVIPAAALGRRLAAAIERIGAQEGGQGAHETLV